MQPQLFERGLSLRLELDQDLPPVQANSARLEQVLTNLLANAIKFTNEGEIVVRAARHGTKVWLSVQDTGIGIAPEYQETIFQAFRQIETPLTRRFGGTGLGLAICKRLVELMGGTIWVESEPGVGSTFHCEFHVAVVQGRHEYIAAQREGEMQAVGRH
jgi:signal transduction histidine kinase